MNAMEKFRDYAADFEKTYIDDDWSRLRTHFADDAVYEVRSAAFGCRLVGPDAIFRGIKKSLDGFDRRFARRELAVDSVREATQHAFELSWIVTYTKDGAPPFVLRGSSRAELVDGRIARLVDSYDETMDHEGREWVAKHGAGFDVSYV
jgi:hypothetical protein